ncbi:MAG: M48 family metallopeptidase [Aeromicrobium sp.]
MTEIEVRRSARRKRSIQVRREGNKTIALVPAHVADSEADEVIARLVERLDRRERRKQVSDDDLIARASRLSADYFGGKAVPSSVRWVSNQNARWGSCTTTDKSIRLSDRLIGMPLWVIDYVLVHELAHLIEANHGRRFWALVAAYPETERAKGFLEGVAHQQP